MKKIFFLSGFCFFLLLEGLSTSALATDTLFENWMKRYAIFNEEFITNELYSWTTVEQVNIIKTNQKVLLKSSSEKFGPSAYDMLLEKHKKEGDEIAGLLLNGLFAKKRFAWPHPWATVRGYPGENYGDQLLRFTFKEEAIVGSFISSDQDTLFRFYDMTRKRLSIAYVKQNFDRIAYVYFVNVRNTDKKMMHYRGTMKRRANSIKRSSGPFPYREYVICNEDMIKEASIGTGLIKKKMEEDISFLKLIQKYFWLDEDKNGCGPVDLYDAYLNRAVVDDWSKNWLSVEMCVYAKVLALVNKYYDLNNEQLNKTIAIMKKNISIQSSAFTINF